MQALELALVLESQVELGTMLTEWHAILIVRITIRAILLGSVTTQVVQGAQLLVAQIPQRATMTRQLLLMMGHAFIPVLHAMTEMT